MFKYLLNTGALNKIDLKIVHYFHHQFHLLLPGFWNLNISSQKLMNKPV